MGWNPNCITEKLLKICSMVLVGFVNKIVTMLSKGQSVIFKLAASWPYLTKDQNHKFRCTVEFT